MAKTESTAVNNLIALAQDNERTSRPIVHPDDDLFARPPTRQQLKPTAAPSRMTGNLPALTTAGPVSPLPRERAPVGTSQLTLPEDQARLRTAPPRPSAVDLTGDVVRAEHWFEASRAVEKFDDPTYVGPSPHKYARANHPRGLLKKLILPALGFVVVGALIGSMIAYSGASRGAYSGASRGAKRGPEVVAPTAVAPTAPMSAPVAPVAPVAASAPSGSGAGIHEVQTPRSVVTLVDVRVDSRPPGATVTLVEHTSAGDKRSFVGSTPIATALDATHEVEVEVELAGHATQAAHLDPAKTTRVSFDFKRVANPVASSAPAAAPSTPVTSRHAGVARAVVAPHSVPGAVLADPFDPAPTGVPAPRPSHELATGGTGGTEGTGSLMLSSKPPCVILVDGKATGLATPQRALELPVGTHKITLVNQAAGINQTVMVQINAGQATKLVKDLLAN